MDDDDRVYIVLAGGTTYVAFRMTRSVNLAFERWYVRSFGRALGLTAARTGTILTWGNRLVWVIFGVPYIFPFMSGLAIRAALTAGAATFVFWRSRTPAAPPVDPLRALGRELDAIMNQPYGRRGPLETSRAYDIGRQFGLGNSITLPMGPPTPERLAELASFEVPLSAAEARRRAMMSLNAFPPGHPRPQLFVATPNHLGQVVAMRNTIIAEMEAAVAAPIAAPRLPAIPVEPYGPWPVAQLITPPSHQLPHILDANDTRHQLRDEFNRLMSRRPRWEILENAEAARQRATFVPRGLPADYIPPSAPQTALSELYGPFPLAELAVPPPSTALAVARGSTVADPGLTVIQWLRAEAIRRLASATYTGEAASLLRALAALPADAGSLAQARSFPGGNRLVRDVYTAILRESVTVGGPALLRAGGRWVLVAGRWVWVAAGPLSTADLFFLGIEREPGHTVPAEFSQRGILYANPTGFYRLNSAPIVAAGGFVRDLLLARVGNEAAAARLLAPGGMPAIESAGLGRIADQIAAEMLAQSLIEGARAARQAAFVARREAEEDAAASDAAAETELADAERRQALSRQWSQWRRVSAWLFSLAWPPVAQEASPQFFFPSDVPPIGDAEMTMMKGIFEFNSTQSGSFSEALYSSNPADSIQTMLAKMLELLPLRTKLCLTDRQVAGGFAGSNVENPVLPYGIRVSDTLSNRAAFEQKLNASQYSTADLDPAWLTGSAVQQTMSRQAQNNLDLTLGWRIKYSSGNPRETAAICHHGVPLGMFGPQSVTGNFPEFDQAFLRAPAMPPTFVTAIINYVRKMIEKQVGFRVITGVWNDLISGLPGIYAKPDAWSYDEASQHVKLWWLTSPPAWPVAPPQLAGQKPSTWPNINTRFRIQVRAWPGFQVLQGRWAAKIIAVPLVNPLGYVFGVEIMRRCRMPQIPDTLTPDVSPVAWTVWTPAINQPGWPAGGTGSPSQNALILQSAQLDMIEAKKLGGKNFGEQRGRARNRPT